jgi:hypothetical protein
MANVLATRDSVSPARGTASRPHAGQGLARGLLHSPRNPARDRCHLLLDLGCAHRKQAPTSATAALSALPTRCASLVGRPLVCRAFLVGGATTFTCDLALLLTTHGSKPATFFARSVHSTPSLICALAGPHQCPSRAPMVRYRFKACASASRASSSADSVNESGVPKRRVIAASFESSDAESDRRGQR